MSLASSVDAQPKAPDPKVPDVKLPAAKVPDVKAPDVKAPDVKAPDVKAPDVKAPDVKAPAVKLPTDKPAEDKPAADKPAGDKDAAGGKTLTDESGVILFGDKKPAAKEAVPLTLPAELAPNVKKKGAKVGFRDKSAGALTIEEIVNSPVTTASKRAESAKDAPAWVLVITAKDIRDRGYSDLSQVLDDLPGVDVIRPGGEYYTRNYVRGYRSVTAEPYLMMRDGIVLNHLFFRHGQVMTTFPLTDVDHIEIAYGPASAIYGTNAAMGIINVITKSGLEEQEQGRTGVSLRSRLIVGGPQSNIVDIWEPTKIIDASMIYIDRTWRVRLSTHLEDALADIGIGTRAGHPYTSDALYSDPKVWNESVLAAYPTLTGDFFSADRKAGVDARLFLGKGTELGAQFYYHSTGFGTAYPADRLQTGGLWTNQEVNIYGRHATQLSPSAHSTTLVQFQHSGVTTPTAFMTRETDTDGTQHAVVRSRVSPHFGVVVTQDFDISAPRNLILQSDELTIGVGLRFQHMENNLGFAGLGYDDLSIIKYPIVGTDSVDDGIALVEDHPLPSFGSEALGGYVVAKYRFAEAHALHLGGRVEYGSLRDKGDIVFRGGYVGNFVLNEKSNRRTGEIEKISLTAKLLYGQAVYEPGLYEVTRARFSAFDQSDGGSYDVKSEDSHTIEADADLTIRKWLALHADGYLFQSADPMIDTPTQDLDAEQRGFMNVGSRQIVGMDVGARFFYPPFHIWAYYSHLFIAQDDCDGIKLPSDFSCTGSHFIGDVSTNKFWGGITLDKKPFVATITGRVMGARETAFTNPIRSVAAYGTIDANMMLYDVPWNGFSFGVRVTNILGTEYVHPGIRTADAGNTAPTGTGATYVGSQGDFNSLLPQAGRSIYATIGFDLDPKEQEEKK